MTEKRNYNRASERPHPLKAMLRTARGNAKRDGKEFTIELSDLPPIPGRCPVFGVKLRMVSPFPQGVEDPHAPSLDRIDNSKGYVPGNVIIICRRANRLKGDATPEELRKLADYYGQSG